MDSSSRDDSGFTLVEIVIAIVLVGILSAVVVVGIGRLTEQGAAAGCAASADAATLFREFGFTPDKVVAAAKRSVTAARANTGPQLPQPSSADTDVDAAKS